MALKRETRKQWGAPADKGKRWVSKATAATGGVAVHYPGATGTLSKLNHDQCRGLLRQWAAMHMNRGSMFLEYGSVICQHGVWMEGRTTFDGGWLARVGSNGTTTANDNFTSVQLMLGTSDRITDEQKAWLAEAIATLREHGWGNRVTGHRDHYATACPGDSIYDALPEIRRMADNWNEEEDMPLTDKDKQDIARMVWAFEIDGRPARWYQRQAHRIVRRWLGPSGDAPEQTRQSVILDVVRGIDNKVDQFGNDDPDEETLPKG